MSSLDASFAALADPTRRAILARLALGEATVNELTEPFDMTQPAISQHLKVLEEAGIVERTVHGRVHQFRLRQNRLQQAGNWIARHQAFWEGAVDQLERVLSESGHK